MAYSALPTRTTADANSAADVNTLQGNIAYLHDKVAKQENHYIYGLEISNDTDTEHDIAVAVGSAIDSTFDRELSLSSSIVKRIDAAWAVGTGNGGLDTGSVAADTWYYIWLIYRSDTEVTDVLFSTSATSPTMPANYDYKRRIRGAVLTDGSSNIIPMIQKDDHFWFLTRVKDLDLANSVTSKTSFIVSVPDALNINGVFSGCTRDGSTIYGNIYSSTEPDRAPSQDDFNINFESGNKQSFNFYRYVENSTLYYRFSTALALDNFTFYTDGFIDPAQEN